MNHRPRPLFVKLGVAALMCFTAGPALARAPADEVVVVFDEAAVEYDAALVDGSKRDGLTISKKGLIIERSIQLPSLPINQRDARQIAATLIVEPVIVQVGDKLRPGDPWTRLGSLSIVKPTADQSSAAHIELMRFITGFGGPGTFTQDITALAPLLEGPTTFRLFISTYKKPAWKVTLRIHYSAESVGYRRPIWAVPLFNEESITAEKNKLKATIEIPAGLARPRIRIITTGHASDGAGGDEFVTRTHVLRVDGAEVVRWRPWAENAGELRRANPMSGRMMIDGREQWSSDFDRSGWRCGEIVEPLLVPLAELTPGTHTIELEILGIRPKDQHSHHGYWRVSGVAVADEPWPEHPDPRQE